MLRLFPSNSIEVVTCGPRLHPMSTTTRSTAPTLDIARAVGASQRMSAVCGFIDPLSS
jgi:hypothetical protein